MTITKREGSSPMNKARIIKSTIKYGAVAAAAGAYGFIAGGVAIESDHAVARAGTLKYRAHARWVSDRALVWPWASLVIHLGRAPHMPKSTD